MRRWVAALVLAACISGCGDRVERAPEGLTSSWGPSLQMAELPDGVQASLGDLEVVVGELTTSTVGTFELDENIVFCVFKDGWIPASDNLLRDFERPYKTPEGNKSYQLVSDLADCPSPAKAIFIAAVVDPFVSPREDGTFDYQLWLAAWQGAGMEGNTIFAATIARDEPREDAAGILDTIRSSAPDASDAALRMSQSLGADGIDIITSIAGQVRAERESQ